MTAVLRMPVSDKHLRQAAPYLDYVSIGRLCLLHRHLAMIGPHPLTVTTNANINFMGGPLVPLIGTARILKLGKQ